MTDTVVPTEKMFGGSADLDSIFAKFPDLMTISDIQKALGVGRSTAYRLINKGQINHLRIGKAIKIPKRYLIDFVIQSCYNNNVVTGNLSCQDVKEGLQ